MGLLHHGVWVLRFVRLGVLWVGWFGGVAAPFLIEEGFVWVGWLRYSSLSNFPPQVVLDFNLDVSVPSPFP
jgi:hypothetical protein